MDQNNGMPVWQAYLQAMRSALLRLEKNDKKTRRGVYNALEEKHRELFENSKASFDPEYIDFHYRMLRNMIRLVEFDIRANKDIFADDYAPDGIEELEQRVVSSRDARISRRKQEESRAARKSARGNEVDLTTTIDSRETELVDILGTGLLLLDSHYRLPLDQVPARNRAAIIYALFIFQAQTVGAESRLAIIWLLVQPVVLIALIMIFYTLAQTSYIINMDVLTFAIVGSTTWIMFRMVILRVSTSIGNRRPLLNLPSVTPLDVTLAQGGFYFFVYSISLITLIYIGYLFNLTTAPGDVLRVACGFGLMWLFALSIGVLFGSISMLWPFFLRFSTVLERALQVFSSVFFVSEQLPEQYKAYVLWNPLAHCMQLLRSAYFPGYVSTDASGPYALICVVCVMTLSGAMLSRVKSDIYPS